MPMNIMWRHYLPAQAVFYVCMFVDIVHVYKNHAHIFS